MAAVLYAGHLVVCAMLTRIAFAGLGGDSMLDSVLTAAAAASAAATAAMTATTAAAAAIAACAPEGGCGSAAFATAAALAANAAVAAAEAATASAAAASAAAAAAAAAGGELNIPDDSAHVPPASLANATGGQGDQQETADGSASSSSPVTDADSDMKASKAAPRLAAGRSLSFRPEVAASSSVLSACYT